MAITTNREYLAVKLSKFGVTADEIEAIVLENPVLEEDLNVQNCKEAMYKTMSSLLQFSDVSEGSYSVKWNLEGLKLWYNSLCLELGKPNVMEPVVVKPQIRNRSNYW